MKKVILVTNIPNPYRIPLFNEMSRQFAQNNLQLKVIFGAEGYKRRYFKLDKNEFKFDYEILNDEAVTFGDDLEKSYFRYKGLTKLLNIEKPAVIIVAGFSIATMKVLFRKLLKGTPFIIFSGTIDHPSGKKNTLRKIQRNIICKIADAFVAYGSKAKEYLVNSGAQPSKVFIGMNTVDTTFFAEKTEAARNNNFPGNNVATFTYLGYLVPRKNVELLLETVKLLAAKRNDFKLDIIGDGSSAEALKNFVKNNDLEAYVDFHGFVQKEELPAHFARSRGLLFQTDFDIWGLVLNEAMAAGVTCLSSPNAGATFDLIEDGKTGFIVDFNDKLNTAEKINWLIDNKYEAAEMGKRAAQFIKSEVSLEKSTKGFVNAVSYVLNKN